MLLVIYRKDRKSEIKHFGNEFGSRRGKEVKASQRLIGIFVSNYRRKFDVTSGENCCSTGCAKMAENEFWKGVGFCVLKFTGWSNDGLWGWKVLHRDCLDHLWKDFDKHTVSVQIWGKVTDCELICLGGKCKNVFLELLRSMSIDGEYIRPWLWSFGYSINLTWPSESQHFSLKLSTTNQRARNVGDVRKLSFPQLLASDWLI